MWYFDIKTILGFYGQSGDMINSSFAFPRLPPRANPPLGISSAGKIKDGIVNDANTMMERLSAHHRMFQRYAVGLFNLTPDRFVPGHPMHLKMQSYDTPQENDEQHAKEKAIRKSKQSKETK